MAFYSRLPNTREISTLWDVYERAVKSQFGQSIRVCKTWGAVQQLNSLNFVVSIESADDESRLTRRTVVDINTKEFANLSDKEVNETMINKKTESETTKTRYTFSTATGLLFGQEEKIGAQVMRLVIAGGSVTVSVNPRRGYTEGHDFDFSFSQEEKISVPPMSKVKAKITTYLEKYEQGYTLRFSLPSSLMLPVTYKTQCQQKFCGTTARTISIVQLCRMLPGYQNDNGRVSFIQSGILSWIGEGSAVHKEVELLGHSLN